MASVADCKKLELALKARYKAQVALDKYLATAVNWGIDRSGGPRHGLMVPARQKLENALSKANANLRVAEKKCLTKEDWAERRMAFRRNFPHMVD